ncbi:hypothetical protein RFM26_08185 [Mesorhizobium sp. VK23B]|uniref:Tyr recombinase domain-containing protein n=1 Tax=Mesorhizobium dulcispinae TaxID=3072316 RepID=A0ABU4X9R5_9HYPH|nr:MULTISPECIES: hypothetical protein [unclassified Mesorhizobium]MDX8465658.1 hypothetical protein [Mesorhizobium sp. VK23B]MDX8471540.1 hypothetical protein [Mesorhizobium sp. VK23A]
MDGFELSQGDPGYFVFDVPVSVHRGVFQDTASEKPDRVLQPVLAIRSGAGDVMVPDESLSWSRHMIDRGVRVAYIRRKLNTVGRLFEYGDAVVGAELSEPNVIDEVIWQYLRARAETPFDPTQRRFQHWQPIQYERVLLEFHDLVEFSQFCGTFTGKISVIGGAFKKQSSVWTTVKKSSPPDHFMAHLEAQRERWNILQGDDEAVAPPSSLRRAATKSSARKKGNTTSLSSEEIDALIDREGNFMLRALWILLAYQGPRTSEALNMFTCDVIDPAEAKKLFLTDFSGQVVIYADPRRSHFLGSFDRKRSREDRTAYLDRRYGLKPRPDAEGEPIRAGWKGMSVFNSAFDITHGQWTCQKRAREFAGLLDDIRDFHDENYTDRLHPYLFANAVNKEHLGQPLKMSNVKKAFDRACWRAGIEPHTPGASLHGFRHYYTWYARHVLGLPDETVQLMLRQKSLASQYTYGKRASDGHDAMKKFASYREANQ